MTQISSIRTKATIGGLQAMRAAMLYGIRDLKLEDISIPLLNSSDVLVKIKYVGVCGTDHAIYSGETSFVRNGLIKYPLILGHEWSGVVESVGSEVSNFRPGDGVVGDSGVSCGKCVYCLNGSYYRCRQLQAIGTINALDGAYAQFIAIPERHLFMKPGNISYEHASLAEPAATALYALDRAGLKAGDTVLIQGTGPIGLAAVNLAKIAGACCIILTGRKDYKLGVGRMLGADITVNVSEEDFYEKVMRATGGDGVDKVIEASGSLDAFQNSMNVMRYGGVFASLAFYEDMADKFDIDKLVLRDITLMGISGSPGRVPKVLNLMACGKLDITPIITHIRELNEVQDVLSNFKHENEKKIKTLLKVD